MTFWKDTPLIDMTQEQWEQLCDGCGKCCLNKIIDDETEQLYYTNVACHLLNHQSCRCEKYPQRFEFVPQCTAITVDNIASLTWLPDSCSYKRLYEGRGLASWHPLITGSKDAMHKAGMSVRKKVKNEKKVKWLEDHIVLWPLVDKD
ncbi:YcgN family cysteine cluster protein [Shewanella intestini]|uniref:UPF0260 protein G3R48_03685 n=1 Tax=Shewanella intestini TaxID=2017544 RepID=A0ABS5HZ84_9GAMM|nr:MULTISPECIES: YcgN family cysteine cluster protein [Shewanella]MBR9727097.1 YcgN family cysteine cluster protein [Shewanella intestini]MRG35899.1 YcgN family cysteine cluster protein [Shewanella sp. XMDDZSB0408]